MPWRWVRTRPASDGPDPHFDGPIHSGAGRLPGDVVEESIAQPQHVEEGLHLGAARGPGETNHLALLSFGEALEDSADLAEAEVAENVPENHAND